MPSRTKAGLNLADKNSYVRVEENINDNLLKIDDDVDGTWGGLYGGRIEDPTVIKEVGKRYIGADGKAYICKVASNINNTTNYQACNVVDNLDKLQSLETLELLGGKITLFKQNKTVWLKIVDLNTNYSTGDTITSITNTAFFPLETVEALLMSPSIITEDKGRIGITIDGKIFARDPFVSGQGKSSNAVYFTK